LPLVPAAIAWLFAGTGLPEWAQIPLAIALVVPIAPLIERIALRPIADASVLLLLIVSVALTFGLSGLGLLFFGAEGFRTKPLTNEIFRFGTVIVTSQTLLMVATAAVFSLLLFLFFEHTLSGKALRATAINRIGARIVGIRPANSGTLAFLLASLLGAISGILIGPVTTVYYDSGFIIGLKAFVGAIIGGLVSYPGTAIGAVLVGLLESFASFWNSSLKEVVVFSVLIPVLLWRSLSLGQVDEEDAEVDG
jgi:branched-chain amino acid transport system permease protein